MSNTRKLGPARQALRDQADAAYAECLDRSIAGRILADGGIDPSQAGFISFQHSAGPAMKIVDVFRSRDNEDTFTYCKHLRKDAPQPAAWQAWRPGRLYCGPCLVSLPRLSSKEDRRCDACGWIGGSITPGNLTVPAKDLPERAGKPAQIRPPVTIFYGLCGRCMAAERADKDRVIALTPVRLDFSLLHSPGPGERAVYLAALEVSRMLSGSGARGTAEFFARDDLPAVNHVAWGLVNLCILVTGSIARYATPADGDDQPSFPFILRSFTDLTARMVENPVIRFDRAIAGCIRKTAALIVSIHDGDYDAFSRLNGTGQAEITVGASYLLEMAIGAMIPAGLAGSPQQVREMLDSRFREIGR
jgi:hypothetical protein